MIALLHFLLLACAIAAVSIPAIRFCDPHHRMSSPERVVIGAVIGTVIVGFATLAIAVVTGKLLVAAYVVIAGILIAAGPSLVRQMRHHWPFHYSPQRPKPHHVALGVLWLLLMGVIFQVLIVDTQGFPQSTLIGWGDTAYHMDMIAHMAMSAPFAIDQPIANGAPLTYPFFINFLSALLARLGIPFLWAWYLPMALFGTTLVGLVFFFAQRLLGSRWYAAIVVALVIFGGGLGWHAFLQDIRYAWRDNGWHGVQETLLHPPHEYTHLDNRTGGKNAEAESPKNIVWITPAISFFSHQRSFAPGFSLALVILIGWIAYGSGGIDDQKIFARWLLLLGFLPLVHSHTALAMGIIFIVLTLQHMTLRQWDTVRWWLVGAAGAGIVALPQLIHLVPTLTQGDRQFFTPWFGWMTCSHTGSWFSCSPHILSTLGKAGAFWTKNFGLVFLGWLATIGYTGFTDHRSSSPLRQLLLPSVALFLIPNLFKLQPWEFDNNKVLMYWWLIAALFSVAVAQHIARSWRKKWVIISAVAVILLGCAAGLIDVSTRVRATWAAWWNRPVANHAGYYSTHEIAAAQWITRETRPSDAFLAADGANNFVPMLTGRPLYLGYPGWLWTQGNSTLIDARRATANNFFSTRDPAPLCAQGVRWLLWEPPLLQTYPNAATSRPEQFGAIQFEQMIPGGQRSIVQLACN